MKNVILLIGLCISSIVIGQNGVIKGKITDGFTSDVKLVKRSFFNGELTCLAPEKYDTLKWFFPSRTPRGTFDQQGFHIEKELPISFFTNRDEVLSLPDTILVQYVNHRIIFVKDSTHKIHRNEFVIIDGHLVNIHEETALCNNGKYFMSQVSKTIIRILSKNKKKYVYTITLSSVPENREKVKDLVQKIIESINIKS